MISRYLVIALAFAAAIIRAQQGAWIEATGLAALGIGLVFLKLAPSRPFLKPLAYLAFLVTALTIAVALIRMWLGS